MLWRDLWASVCIKETQIPNPWPPLLYPCRGATLSLPLFQFSALFTEVQLTYLWEKLDYCPCLFMTHLGLAWYHTTFHIQLSPSEARRWGSLLCHLTVTLQVCTVQRGRNKVSCNLRSEQQTLSQLFQKQSSYFKDWLSYISDVASSITKNSVCVWH